MAPRKSDDAPIRFDEPSARRLDCGHGELRCGCGSLLARVIAGAVELKCRRCKRTWNIPLEQP